ncbi:MAG: hypothetical protein ABIQ16_05270 [Polyangiaceae bacterium]
MTRLDVPQPAPGDAVGAAVAARAKALKRCDKLLSAIPLQEKWKKDQAYGRKQGGLLTTTIVGVAGSIVTAVLASKMKPDSSGKVDTGPTTIVGSSTAGATAIAGVVSLFVVGQGADEDIKIMEGYRTEADAKEKSLDSCAQPKPEEAALCTSNAERIEAYCEDIALTRMPYSGA